MKPATLIVVLALAGAPSALAQTTPGILAGAAVTVAGASLDAS